MKAKFCKGCIHEKDCDEEEVYVFENDEGEWECEHYFRVGDKTGEASQSMVKDEIK